MMLTKAKEKKMQITQKAFKDHGKNITYFDGVEEFFEKINAYAKTKNIII